MKRRSYRWNLNLGTPRSCIDIISSWNWLGRFGDKNFTVNVGCTNIGFFFVLQFGGLVTQHLARIDTVTGFTIMDTILRQILILNVFKKKAKPSLSTRTLWFNESDKSISTNTRTYWPKVLSNRDFDDAASIQIGFPTLLAMANKIRGLQYS